MFIQANIGYLIEKPVEVDDIRRGQDQRELLKD
jgi:hypothetical protein